jgi:HSP20 family protein
LRPEESNVSDGLRPTFLDLHRQVQEVFEELIYRRWPVATPAGWRPPADVFETGDSYVVEIDLPGIPPEQIQLLVSDHSLTVFGCREVTAPARVVYGRCECTRGQFRRTVEFAEAIDSQAARAVYAHGTCRFIAPKKRHSAGAAYPVESSETARSLKLAVLPDDLSTLEDNP